MGRKVFVSYKYGDSFVQSLGLHEQTRVRHYVDKLQELLEKNDHINKGEQDDESLAHFKEGTIASKLRDKIYDSSITIVVVSKGMKGPESEEDQWIPWEISYSLKEHARNDRASKSNAMLAVVLPDESGGYSYYIEDETCPHCKCRTLKTEFLFNILKKNMFNSKKPEHVSCSSHVGGGTVYSGDHSYIPSVKWSDFCSDVNKYFETVERINANIADYDITKQV